MTSIHFLLLGGLVASTVEAAPQMESLEELPNKADGESEVYENNQDYDETTPSVLSGGGFILTYTGSIDLQTGDINSDLLLIFAGDKKEISTKLRKTHTAELPALSGKISLNDDGFLKKILKEFKSARCEKIIYGQEDQPTEEQ